MKKYITFISVSCISIFSLVPLFVFLASEDRRYTREKIEKSNSVSTSSSSSVDNSIQKFENDSPTSSATSSSSISTSTSLDATTTTSPQKVSSSPQIDKTTETKKSVFTEVPFTPQAPTANWDDPRQQNACEEASVLMAMKWVRGESLSTEESLQEILSMTEFGQERYGDHRDLSASTTQDLVRNYFNFKNSELTYDITKEDIIKELEQGKIVVAPVDGTVLNNSYYVPPGPKEHMIVIHGFDREAGEFITNDPGTSRGEDFRYSFDVLEESLRDYNTGYHEPVDEKRTAMISFSKPEEG